jgi:eukaryotic-like serine/threonine-protein kinase
VEPALWQKIERIYHLIREHDPPLRAALLQKACGDDEALLREVQSLLNQGSGAEEYMNAAVLEADRIAQELLDGGRSEVSFQFKGSLRFIPRERVGAGSSGEVYRVLDRQSNSEVALKKLKQFHPANLLRFKLEFRSLADLIHPNLVRMYELFGENDEWFFTMEFVTGVDFRSHVRPDGIVVDWQRLRAAMYQLSTGVQALHGFGKLHRDLKPSNVIVKPDGRVVLLDFGLVKDLESLSEQSLALAGSPAYMAPEQFGNGIIDETADWYAVGVMLYDAITGQLPFGGPWTEVLRQKREVSAPECNALVLGTPPDLDIACRLLLDRNPEVRREGVKILLRPHREGPKSAVHTRDEFVGRHRELASLRKAFSAVRAGNQQVVLLRGRSGIGKTALMSRFFKEVKLESPDAALFQGRCRDSESVPYRALDPIADELVRFLRRLSRPLTSRFLPRHPELLEKLFPVFGELEVGVALQGRSMSDPDEQRMRRQAFEAFCDLLGRISDQTPMVLAIDDLQWSDLDSIALISDLVLSANPAPLMLILSFRSEDMGASPPLEALFSFRQRFAEVRSCLDIELEGLSDDECRNLLRELQAGPDSITDEESDQLLREAAGNPFLLGELLHYVSSKTERRATIDSFQPQPRLLVCDMICARAQTLSSTARQMLEVLAVFGEPTLRSLLCSAVTATDEAPVQAIGRLVHERYIRITGDAEDCRIEPFHDQVREASLSWLSPGERRNWHERLAQLLRGSPDIDPQILLRHQRGAGDLAAVLEAAPIAAQIAETALAFEQAAQLYGEAIATGLGDERQKAELIRKRADALANAGRGFESGQSYLRAANWPQHNDAVEMRRRAAEEFLKSGHLDEGIQIFFDLLASIGVRAPARRLESLLRMLVVRFLIRLRGLRWRERTEQEIPPEALRRLDLLWSGAMALVTIDTILGSYLQALHMLAALRRGEPSRLALSFSFAAIYECIGGTREYHHGRKLITFAQQLAENRKDDYLLAMIQACWGGLDFLSGNIEDGLLHSRAAVSGLKAISRRRSAWELGTSNMMLTWFLGWEGKIQELSETIPILAAEGRSRGDLYTEVSLRCCATSHLIDLAADKPDDALAGITRSIQLWRKTSYDLPHLYATYARVECLLYADRVEEARHLLLSDWPFLKRSLFTRKSQIHKTLVFYMRARTALPLWLRQPGDRKLRAEVEHFAQRLRKLGSRWGDALSRLMCAGIAAGTGHDSAAVRELESAEAMLRQQRLYLLAAAALRRQGELMDVAGVDRIAAADKFMRSEGIVRPERITAMVLPGAWR